MDPKSIGYGEPITFSGCPRRFRSSQPKTSISVSRMNGTSRQGYVFGNGRRVGLVDSMSWTQDSLLTTEVSINVYRLEDVEIDTLSPFEKDVDTL